MRIDRSVGKKTTTLKWLHIGEKKSIRLTGRVEAAYSESKGLIVAVGADGVIHIITPDGTIVSEFSFDISERCKFYVVTKSTLTELGVVIVMAHDPEYKGERFWQHGIDINSRQISGPLSKWR